MNTNDYYEFLDKFVAHPRYAEFRNLCLKLSREAKVQDIPRELVCFGVAWSSEAFLKSRVLDAFRIEK